MPIPTSPSKNSSAILERLALHLRLRGPLTSVELQAHFRLSQPQLSRYLRALSQRVIRVGRGRRSLYLHTREIPLVGSQIPIYKINLDGSIAQTGVLYPTAPKGFYWECAEAKRSRLFPDLPYFLDDLRPSGFLGRLIPRSHPGWDFPEDVRLWTAETTFRYLSNFGVDLIGNQLIGETAAQKYLQLSLSASSHDSHGASSDSGTSLSPIAAAPNITFNITSEIEQYETLARTTEERGIPGSSAGGEHPKFLTVRRLDGHPVIVKFTPHHLVRGQVGAQDANSNLITQRRVDLLKAEHLAAKLLATITTSDTTSEQAPSTRFIDGRDYCFLEVQRFDRTQDHKGVIGRRGIISLLSLDLEFTGSGKGWSEVAEKLASQNILTAKIVEEIRFLEYFGHLIGNTDMHLGNISFFFEEERVIGLTPCYDMLPMQYSPSQGRINSSPITLIAPNPAGLTAWHRARAAALTFWQKVQLTSEQISSNQIRPEQALSEQVRSDEMPSNLEFSPNFQEIASKNESLLKSTPSLG